MAGLGEVAELIRRETGIILPASRQTALRSALRQAAPGLDPDGFLREAADPVRGPAMVDRLVDAVTTQETSFARDQRQFDAIDWRALLTQAMEAGDSAIRVWSAGCATGEEVYTLAIRACDAFDPNPAPVDILGTDISPAALAAARVGRYRPRAVRTLGVASRHRHLRFGDDGIYRVSRHLRHLVRFRRHNLIREPVPPPGESPFDLIVCRNVLIYFEPDVAARLIGDLERAMRQGGMLILGAVDALYRDRGSRATQFAAPVGPAPDGGQPSLTRGERLALALRAADHGDQEGSLAQVGLLLKAEPLDADAHFVEGLVRLGGGDAAGAVAALRRALYSDATFALAAFTLGRAYDALGDPEAARRSYQGALRTIDIGDERHDFLLQQVDLADICAACRVRLGGEA